MLLPAAHHIGPPQEIEDAMEELLRFSLKEKLSPTNLISEFGKIGRCNRTIYGDLAKEKFRCLVRSISAIEHVQPESVVRGFPLSPTNVSSE
jgi:hypothetical protein